VTYPEERWQAVSRQIVARMKDLGMSQAELVRASSVSDPSVRSLMRGEPGNRQPPLLAKVSRALGWTATSIEAVLDGGTPTVVEVDASPLDERLRDVERRLAELADLVQSMEPPGGPAS
jgi:transcriptional regulator with XRE-family HTH domain